MRRFFGLLGLLALGAIPARAQITPRYEVGAGFDFTLAGPQTLTSSTATPRLNMYGWNTNGVYNLNRYVGVAVDLSGVYNVQTEYRERHHSNVSIPRRRARLSSRSPQIHPLRTNSFRWGLPKAERSPVKSVSRGNNY
jgi:hypothetical protein